MYFNIPLWYYTFMIKKGEIDENRLGRWFNYVEVCCIR